MVGFDMTAMSEGSYDEAIVDIVGPETVASEPFVVKVSSYCVPSKFLDSLVSGSHSWRDNHSPARIHVRFQLESYC